jgi:uncharacterized damage-inducible protein DinB
MKTETQKIQSLLKRTFEKHAWHGPSVTEVLQKITPETANNRMPNTHSIAELVGHMAAWRTYVIHVMAGDHEYKVSDEMNFRKPEPWPEPLRLLSLTQQQLMDSLEKFPPEKLSELVPHPTNKYTYHTLIHGIIHHDLYHTGQIMLIYKATAVQSL